jgi:hypothetical protein
MVLLLLLYTTFLTIIHSTLYTILLIILTLYTITNTILLTLPLYTIHYTLTPPTQSIQAHREYPGHRHNDRQSQDKAHSVRAHYRVHARAIRG